MSQTPKPNFQRGFTLIELLVAIGVVLLLLGMAMVNYFRFNERQALIQGAEQVREAIADAQNSARSGKLRGCDVLRSYQITVSAISVEVQSVCNGGSPDSARVFPFPSGVTAVDHTYYISPLHGRFYTNPNLDTRVDSSEIILSNNQGLIIVTVDYSGAVQVGDISL